MSHEYPVSATRLSPRLAGALGAGLLLLALVTGCAAPAPRTMQFDRGDLPPDQQVVFPGAPDVPRYVFIGHLTGERNFVREKGEESAASAKGFLAFLVGLGLERDAPVQLQRPQGGAVDPAGRILVSDVARGAVFVFDPNAGELTVWEQATGRDRFIAPIGVAIAPGGKEVLVADAEHGAVFRLDMQGQPLGEFGRLELNRPTGVTVDEESGDIFVADTDDNDVKVYDGAFRLTGRIGDGGDGIGQLNSPTYLDFADGELYVTDTLNCRVQVYGREGELRRSFGERGVYVGNFSRPKGITVDDEGNVYVVESLYDHMLVFDREGRYLLGVGGSGRRPGQFQLPAGIWSDGRNRLYVADMFNARVAVFQFLGGNL